MTHTVMTTSHGRAEDHEPDLVGRYLREIGATALLTAAEEIELAQRIEAGEYAAELIRRIDAGDSGEVSADREELVALVEDGRAAKDHMIQANLRLVVTAARKWRRTSGLALLDLIQEGNLGLIRAVEKFDYTKGYKFSTYAMWWIRQAMQRGVDFTGRTIRLPSYVSGQLAKMERVERELAGELQRDPSTEELAEAADMPVERVIELRGLARTTTSLDLPVGDDGTTLLGELIEGSASPHAAEVVEQDTLAAQLRDVMAELGPVERRVISLRFGLEDGWQHTQADTARRLGLPRKRVGELEQQALAQLRDPEHRRALLDLVS